MLSGCTIGQDYAPDGYCLKGALMAVENSGVWFVENFCGVKKVKERLRVLSQRECTEEIVMHDFA